MVPKGLLVLDLGTSRLRCHIFTPRGGLVASASQGMKVQTEEEISPLSRSLDPSEVWRSLCRLIRRAMAQAGLRGLDIGAVSATSQRQGVVFLDTQGREIYAGPNMDLRAVFEGMALDEKLGPEIFDTTGHWPSFLLAPARLSWFRKHQPETFESVSTVLPLADWILFKLCGSRIAERSLAAEAGLVDLRNGQPATGLFKAVGLAESLVPSLGLSGEAVGRISARASEESGLKAQTPVVLGGPDTQCGLLGMGLTETGSSGVVSGWSTPVQLITSGPIFDDRQKLWTGYSVLPGHWVLEANAAETGSSYRWLLRLLLGSEDEAAHRKAERLASRSPAGSMEVLALLGAGTLNQSTLSLGLGGLLFPVPMILAEVDRGHILRAALESVAFAVRSGYQQLEEVSGNASSPTAVTAVGLTGGFSRSPLFCHILASVLGREVNVASQGEATGLGAAMAAATGIGVYESLAEAAQAMKARTKPVSPEGDWSAAYNDYYQRWLKVSEEMAILGQEVL